MSRAFERRVLVAMSGGVDSSVAAALLVEEGWEVVGVTLRLVGPRPDTPISTAVPTERSLDSARAVARQLGIEHLVLDCVEAFALEVINPFIGEYRAGRTPNPCVVCNRTVKFGLMYAHARELGASGVASGHYARVEPRVGRLAVRRAVDGRKDQSYVLAALTQDVLAHVLFPLGEATKEAVREKARALGLAAAERDESQEICFVPDDDYRRFLLERCGSSKPGPILSSKDEVLGEHQGLIHYTVGQRKGLGIAASRPYYVLELDPARNAVVVGHEEETYCRHFTVTDINWCALAPQTDPFDCLVQIRYLHTAAPATVTPSGNRFDVRFHEPQRAVTPGQWAVCYDADGYLLAAGVIEWFTAKRP